ncbi:unnamed protein product [Soboliphyme baturini]|uniref:BLOC-1-related complex subunit 7 n=1 Tax=Soboliphyme baturini TaxID=241478 RepID=A0A183J059_9BILA|nr:unnamed protein product [Soboliphyme baturini]
MRYVELHKALANAVAKTKVDSSEKFGQVLESNFHTANKVFRDTSRRLRSAKKGSLEVLKDRSGQPFTENEDILRLW